MRQETRTQLPTLNNLRIASPCEERWRDMEGDDRVRVCAKCERRVYNFAALTRAEIPELLIQTEGAICARLFQRSDGTILTADCPVGRASRIRRLAFSALVSALFLLGACVMALGASTGPRTHDNPTGLAPWIQELAKKADELNQSSKPPARQRQQYVGPRSSMCGRLSDQR